MIRNDLIQLSDLKYKDFIGKLVPNIDKQQILGIRMPVLREFVKKANFDKGEYLDNFDFKYQEEKIVAILLINEIKDFDFALNKTQEILPYLDNWALTDAFSFKAHLKNKTKMMEIVKDWLKSDDEYTTRLGILYLMKAEITNPLAYKLVSDVSHEGYYVKMMQAWFLCEGMIKAPKLVLPYLENQRFEKWTHNKAIQKCIESFRISKEDKDHLRTLKM